MLLIFNAVVDYTLNTIYPIVRMIPMSQCIFKFVGVSRNLFNAVPLSDKGIYIDKYIILTKKSRDFEKTYQHKNS